MRGSEKKEVHRPFSRPKDASWVPLWFVRRKLRVLARPWFGGERSVASAASALDRPDPDPRRSPTFSSLSRAAAAPRASGWLPDPDPDPDPGADEASAFWATWGRFTKDSVSEKWL